MKKFYKIVAVLLCILLVSNMVPAAAVKAVVPPTGSWQDSGVPDTAWYTEQTTAGQGSGGNPYTIDTAEELAGLASVVNSGNNFSGRYIRLEADLDLAGLNWVSIGTNDNRFSGNFDGNGHVVKNLTQYDTNGGSTGLFGYIDSYWGSCSVKNLGVVDVNISGDVYYGAAIASSVVIDSAFKTAIFDNCFSTGNITSDSIHARLGGLFAYLEIINANNSTTTVSNSYSSCNISATSADNQIYYSRYVGGLIGYIDHFGGSNLPLTVSNCYSTSTVSTASASRTRMGGFVGTVNTTNQISMTNCLFDTQAAGVGYAFSNTSATFAGVTGMTTSGMTGIGALPAGWDGASVWQDGDSLYPQLRVFSGSDGSIMSAVPVFLYENIGIPALSDTAFNVRHDFTVPVVSVSGSAITWSASPGGILDLNGGLATFTSPASDTLVTVTAQSASGVYKDFTVLCKSGVDTSDITPPDITIGDIVPTDKSVSIPVTSDENADIYVLVKLSSEPAPDAGSIVASGGSVKGSGASFTATVNGLQYATDYVAYAVGIDANGNVSAISNKAFSTLQDQTPPSYNSIGFVIVNGTSVNFNCNYNEAGTLKYVVLPANESSPSKEQVTGGLDASGDPAYYSGEETYPSAGANRAISIDATDFALGSYITYLVCVDATGNISDVLSDFGHFTLTGSVTFTVTDGTAPIEGAQVKAGAVTQTTDVNGQTVFNQNAGTYSYLVTKTGFVGTTGTYDVNKASNTVNVTLTSGTGGFSAFTFTVEDSNGSVKGAEVTIGTDTVTTNSSGTAEFYLEAGDYNYTVVSPGRSTMNGNITLDETTNTEAVMLGIDPDGVALTISNHVAGSLKSEVDTFMSANSITDYNLIKHLVVIGGAINSTDTDQTFAYGNCLGTGIETIDFTGTSFTGNTIPNNAFRGCQALSSILLPDDVTTIGTNAFYQCTGLQTISMPETVTSIYEFAFSGCSSLESLTLPDSIEYVNLGAFSDCTSLKDVYIDLSVPPAAYSNAFAGVANGAIIHVPSGSGTNYISDFFNKKWIGLIVEDPATPDPELWTSVVERTIEDSARITLYADEPCTCYLAIVGDGEAEPVIDTTGIGEAFTEGWYTPEGTGYYTYQAQFLLNGLETGAMDIYLVLKDLSGNLSEVYKADLDEYIPSIDVVIDNHQDGELNNEIEAFMISLGMTVDYSKIKSITITGGTMNIDDWGVFDVNHDSLFISLQSVDLSGTTLEYDYVPDYAFVEYYYLKDVILPDSVITIGEGSFAITGLETVTLPESSEYIGDYAFAECSNLSSVTILSAIPPIVGESPFVGIAEGAVLCVSEDCITAYQAVDDGDTTDNYWYGLEIQKINTPPSLKSGVAKNATGSVTVNNAYTLNLTNIFEDIDSDPLTYKVSINNAAAITANSSYSYTPTTTGTVTLEFKANDGNEDSTDTYMVTLTVNPVNNDGNNNGNNNGNNTNNNGTQPPDTGLNLPVIEGNDTQGWEAIGDYLTDTDTGSLTINMNESTQIPSEILAAIQGQDITVTFVMANGIEWIINGNDITDTEPGTGEGSGSPVNSINLQVTLNSDNVPENLIENLAPGSNSSLQLSLAYEGSFGFTATLRINMDNSNQGMNANLYYYNPVTGMLELQSVGLIGEDGYAEFDFSHASDYVIIMDDGDALAKLAQQIQVTPAKQTLYIGGSNKNKMADIKVEYPQPLAKAISDGICDKNVTYTSSNPQVASVTSYGKIIAKAEGKTTIITTITMNGVKNSFITTITVKKAYIELTASVETMKKGEAFTFAAVGYGVEMEKITWVTSRRSIIVINKATGKATAVAAGIDYVIAKVGGIQVKVKVVVK